MKRRKKNGKNRRKQHIDAKKQKQTGWVIFICTILTLLPRFLYFSSHNFLFHFSLKFSLHRFLTLKQKQNGRRVVRETGSAGG